jgi:hypothetical protein
MQLPLLPKREDVKNDGCSHSLQSAQNHGGGFDLCIEKSIHRSDKGF